MTGPAATQELSRGTLCYERGDLEGAIASFRQALALDAGLVVAHYNLGVALRDAERPQEAWNAFQEALRLRPEHARALNNLGVLAERGERHEEALDWYRRAIATRHDFPDAHFNLGLLLLKLGRFAEGWAECEWRWQTERFTPLKAPQPRWDGRRLSGTLLLHTEQGAGDAIQFARFLPQAAARCAQLLLIAPEALHGLFRPIAGVAEIRGAGTLPLAAFEAHAPLMSLPHLLQLGDADLTMAAPYLRAPPAAPLPGGDGVRLKVGLAWAGSATHSNDRHRSCPLEALRPLCAVPGVRLYSLQRELREGDAVRVASLGIIDLAARLTDFSATAGVLGQLDLLVTVDTAVAHLAGALGRPAWVLLSHSSDWRWQLQRTDSPWYPALRLFRQARLDDWPALAHQVAGELHALTAQRARDSV